MGNTTSSPDPDWILSAGILLVDLSTVFDFKIQVIIITCLVLTS